MTATDKLKPCPFCGSEAKTHETIDGWIVSCNSEQSELDGFTHMAHGYGSTEAEAIAAWNRRGRMSITDELREYARGCAGGMGGDALRHIADSIDAEHEAKVSYWQAASYKDGYDEGFASADDWLNHHEDVMAERGWVRLPVDADGVPIRVGDVMEFTYDPPQDKPVFEVSGIGADGTLFYAPRGEVFPRKSTKASVVRHRHEPTVEDVLREFTDAILEWSGKSGSVAEVGTWSDVAAQYAAKLRMAGDAE